MTELAPRPPWERRQRYGPPPGPHRRSVASPCRNFVRNGWCQFGARCHYAHPPGLGYDPSATAGQATDHAPAPRADDNQRAAVSDGDDDTDDSASILSRSQATDSDMDLDAPEDVAGASSSALSTPTAAQVSKPPTDGAAAAAAATATVPAATPAMHLSPYPQRPGMSVCPYYRKHGWCGFKHNCRYNHPPLEDLSRAANPGQTHSSSPAASAARSGGSAPMSSGTPMTRAPPPRAPPPPPPTAQQPGPPAAASSTAALSSSEYRLVRTRWVSQNAFKAAKVLLAHPRVAVAFRGTAERLGVVQVFSPDGQVTAFDLASAPRAADHILEVALRPLLTSPDIVKVAHGLGRWAGLLASDFGITVAPVIDTAELDASRPGGGGGRGGGDREEDTEKRLWCLLREFGILLPRPNPAAEKAIRDNPSLWLRRPLRPALHEAAARPLTGLLDLSDCLHAQGKRPGGQQAGQGGRQGVQPAGHASGSGSGSASTAAAARPPPPQAAAQAPPPQRTRPVPTAAPAAKQAAAAPAGHAAEAAAAQPPPHSPPQQPPQQHPSPRQQSQVASPPRQTAPTAAAQQHKHHPGAVMTLTFRSDSAGCHAVLRAPHHAPPIPSSDLVARAEEAAAAEAEALETLRRFLPPAVASVVEAAIANAASGRRGGGSATAAAAEDEVEGGGGGGVHAMLLPVEQQAGTVVTSVVGSGGGGNGGGGVAGKEQRLMSALCVDQGRPIRLRFTNGSEVSLSVLGNTSACVEALGTGSNNPFSGGPMRFLPGCLHSVAALRSKGGALEGLTYRVGRSLPDLAPRLLMDLLSPLASWHRSSRTPPPLLAPPGMAAAPAPAPSPLPPSLLLLGPPQGGKTSALRSIARCLSTTLDLSVVAVDPSGELSGDGAVPHESLGGARRVQYAGGGPGAVESAGSAGRGGGGGGGGGGQLGEEILQQQGGGLEALIHSAASLHMPQVLVVDDVSTPQEVAALCSAAHRGITVVACARSASMRALVVHPDLRLLAGSFQAAPAADGTALPPVPLFSAAIEALSPGRVVVHPYLAASVQVCLGGGTNDGGGGSTAAVGGGGTMQAAAQYRWLAPSGRVFAQPL